MWDALDGIEMLRLPVRWLRTRVSRVSVGSGGASIRNFPRRSRNFALDQVDRFDWEEISEGRACVLLLRDGTHVRVWGADEDEPGTTTLLNNTLRDIRAADK
jgi:hypothetical protein